MKNNILRWIIPAFWGIFMLTGVRIVTDFQTGMKFWQREFSVNSIEILGCICYGFLCDAAIRLSMKSFYDRHISQMKLLGLHLLAISIFVFPFVKIIHLMADIPDRLEDYMIAWFITLLSFSLHFASIHAEKSNEEIDKQRLQLEKMKSQQLDTELQLLKSQYHPHFLFNALNTIYFQIDENNPLPRNTIEKLSNLLRYQLYQIDETVTLEKEIEYSRNYIELMRMRKSENLKLEIDFDRADPRQIIYPLLFQPLIENAFKYVGGDNYINISLVQDSQSCLNFEIINSVPPQAPQTDLRKKGIGIDNLRRRLDILYAGSYTLETQKQENEFIARLKVNLQ